MAQDRFSIIFKKLEEAKKEEGFTEQSPAGVIYVKQELDEIDELRKIVLNITEPEAQSYTTT